MLITSLELAAGQYSQLIFGGFDTSRYQPNGVQFQLSQDVTRDIVVGVQSILYTGETSSTLLAEPIYAFIESTDPNIWLPMSACLQFEQAFGLKFDNETQKYLMNETQYTALSISNPSVTFRLATSTTGGSTADITLPFKAFGLKAAYPFVPNSTYYFPLQRAANETQYTLGRAFLQEAYLTVDYDRGNFSVSQCTWQQGAIPKVESIIAPISVTNNTNSTTNHSENVESKGGTNIPAIAGSVATVGALSILGVLGFWFWRRRKQQRRKEEKEAAAVNLVALQDVKPDPAKGDTQDADDNVSMHGRYKKDTIASIYSPRSPESEYIMTPQGELPGHGHEIHEISAVRALSEMGDTDSGMRSELESPLPVEMEGNNYWQRYELPSPVSVRNLPDRSDHISNRSEVSMEGLLGVGSPVAWNSVSSRISSRSRGPMSISSIDEVRPPEDDRFPQDSKP